MVYSRSAPWKNYRKSYSEKEKNFKKNPPEKRKALLKKRQKLKKLRLSLLQLSLEKKLSLQIKKPVILTIRNIYDFFTSHEILARALYLFIGDAKENPVRRRHYFKEFCYGFFCGFLTQNPKLLCYFITKGLRETRKHYIFLKILYFFIMLGRAYFKLHTLRVELIGKINGRRRTTKVVYNFGYSIPLFTYDTKISYYFQTIHTYTGAFGLRVWLLR